MKPGAENIRNEDDPAAAASRIARPPDAKDASMNINVTCFATAKSPTIANDGISRFLSSWIRCNGIAPEMHNDTQLVDFSFIISC